MKKLLLATAVATLSVSAAHAAPTVYGKVFLTADYTDTNYDDNYRASATATSAPNDESTVKLNSNASRIGFKGSEELTDTTKLIYQLEYQINPDDDSQQFRSRDTYIGLAHNTLGTLIAGRHDTPFKLAKGGVDVFNDYDNVWLGKLMVGENRVNNVIAYKSPTLVGVPVTFMAAAVLSEEDKDADVANTDIDEGANGYSASLAYDQNGVYLAAGYDNNIQISKTDSAWRLAGSVDMGKINMVPGLTLGALYQETDVADKSDDEKSWLVSGKYKIGATPWAVKAQYIDTSNQSGVKDRDAQEIALGAEYSFNKATKGHLYAAQIDTDNVSDKTIVGGGLEYKF
ncbi:porin [Moraxella osloensis]|nr:porin [Moraxella osloensis]ATQ84680.1 porin [Moraxella osloensis]